jgi:hypothetical protein
LIIGIAAVGYYLFIVRKKKLIPESFKQSTIGKLSEVRGNLSKN